MRRAAHAVRTGLAIALFAVPAAARADTPSVPPGIDPAWARVRIFATSPKVTLERRLGSVPGDASSRPSEDGGFTWKVVCSAPCNEALPIAGEYRVGGEDVVLSESFALHAPNTHLLIEAGARPLRRAGTWLTILGLLAATGGGVFFGVQAAHSGSSGIGAGGDAAIGLLAGGGAIGIAGIGMIIASGTTVRDEQRRELAQLGPLPQRYFGNSSTLNATFRF